MRARGQRADLVTRERLGSAPHLRLHSREELRSAHDTVGIVARRMIDHAGHGARRRRGAGVTIRTGVEVARVE